MADEELKAVMRERGFGLRGRGMRAHYIRALEAPDGQERRDLNEYQTWKDDVGIQVKIQCREHISFHHLTGLQRDLVEQAERDRK